MGWIVARGAALDLAWRLIFEREVLRGWRPQGGGAVVQWRRDGLQAMQGNHQLRALMGIQFNAIAQNFVENPTYFGPEVQANPRLQDWLRRAVPLGRLVSARDDALLAAYLDRRRRARRVYQASGFTW